MNIIVCIKQVPDTTDVQINPQTNTLVREGVKSVINPFDRYAIEEGVRLKEKFGGKVIVLTMGPAQAESALREAISLGCDEAVLLSDRAFAGSDTWVTSYTLSKAIRKIREFDLILCGKQASDGDTAQVGPGIAAHLDIAQVAYVKKIENLKDGLIRVERMTEEGYEVFEVSFPLLLTVVKEINEPRLPSLRGLMRSKQVKITVWTAADISADVRYLGLNGSPTQVIKIFSPEKRKGGRIFNGPVDEAVNAVVEELKKIALISFIIFALSGCFSRDKTQAICILRSLAQEKTEQEQIIELEKERFRALVEAIENSAIKKGLSEQDVRRLYGEPLLEKPSDIDGIDKALIFVEPLNYFAGQKVYLYFDKDTKLVSWEIKMKTTEKKNTTEARKNGITER